VGGGACEEPGVQRKGDAGETGGRPSCDGEGGGPVPMGRAGGSPLPHRPPGVSQGDGGRGRQDDC